MDRSAYDRYFELDQRHFWRVARREMVLDLIARHRPRDGALRLLDVGGACSLISREMTRYGDVTVVEPDAETADFARRELGLDVRKGSLPDQMPVEGPFDVITLLDVLEHIEDDSAALRAVIELLCPGGLLLVTVPAVPWLWSGHDVSVHHKRRYMRPGLRRLLEGGGLLIERLSYHTSLLFPVIAAQRAVSRLHGVDPNAKYDVKIPPAPINALFRGIMEIEGRILRHAELPIGSSLVAVCRRPSARA
jgi:SAM-dependent methyltransferase